MQLLIVSDLCFGVYFLFCNSMFSLVVLKIKGNIYMGNRLLIIKN